MCVCVCVCVCACVCDLIILIQESFSLWEAQKWLKIITKGDSAMFIYRLKVGHSTYISMYIIMCVLYVCIQTENRRFRIKFSPMSSLTSSLETCRQFVTLLAPLVPIREMSDVCSTRGKDTSTRAMESDSQFDEDSQMLNSSQIVALGYDPHLQRQRSHNIPPHSQEVTHRGSGVGTSTIQPDESKLIPVPDIATVLSQPPSIFYSIFFSLVQLLQTEGKTLGRAYADTNFPTEQLGRFIRLCLTDSNFPGFVESVEKELNSMAN